METEISNFADDNTILHVIPEDLKTIWVELQND